MFIIKLMISFKFEKYFGTHVMHIIMHDILLLC
jgi:hypothetical protein